MPLCPHFAKTTRSVYIFHDISFLFIFAENICHFRIIMDQLQQQLNEYGDAIIKLSANFKKDPKERKNKEYFGKKATYLESLYRSFTDVEKKIDEIDSAFDLEYRNQIVDIYEQLENTFRASTAALEKNSAPKASHAFDFLKNNIGDKSASASSSTVSNTFATSSPTKTNDDSVQTRLAMEKIDELNAIVSTLQAENNSLKKIISDLESNIVLVDQLRLEKDTIEQQFKALKANYDRVVYDKRTLQIRINQLSSSNSSHSNSNNNSSPDDLDSELFPIRDLIKLIPKFSGDRAQLRVYINKCSELWSFVKDGVDQARFITVLKNNLSGEAALLLLDEDELEDWESIRSLLNQNFNSDPNHSNNIALMQSMKQNRNESVEDFCGRIKTILVTLKSSIPTGATKHFWFDHTERQAVQALEDGLVDLSLQSRVVAAQKTSFNLASQYAIETAKRLTSKFEPHPTQKYQHDSTASKEKSFCRYCKKPNHTIENCRLRQKNNDKKTTSDQTDFKCTICKTNSHSTDICYKNPDRTTKPEKTSAANILTNEKKSENNSKPKDEPKCFEFWLEDSEN